MAAAEPVRAREIFDRYATSLRNDLGLEPTPETAAILDVAPPASARYPVAAVPDSTAAPHPHHADVAAVADGNAGSGVPPEVSAAPAEVPAPSGLLRGMRRVLLPAAALMLLLTGALADWVFDSRREAEAASVTAVSSGNRVGIFPFQYRGHPELAYLGEGISELIGISIQSLDQISLLDPRALASSRGSGTEVLQTVDAAARPARPALLER
jgi:hypothetical protein